MFDKRILGGKGFAVRLLKRHNFCPASVSPRWDTRGRDPSGASWNTQNTPNSAPNVPNASRCSTIWQTQAVQAWCKALGIHFDECQLGRLRCNHEQHERLPAVTSSDLSRYPPEMMQGISQPNLWQWWCDQVSRFAHYEMVVVSRALKGVHHPWGSHRHHWQTDQSTRNQLVLESIRRSLSTWLVGTS